LRVYSRISVASSRIVRIGTVVHKYGNTFFERGSMLGHPRSSAFIRVQRMRHRINGIVRPALGPSGHPFGDGLHAARQDRMLPRNR